MGRTTCSAPQCRRHRTDSAEVLRVSPDPIKSRKVNSRYPSSMSRKEKIAKELYLLKLSSNVKSCDTARVSNLLQNNTCQSSVTHQTLRSSTTKCDSIGQSLSVMRGTPTSVTTRKFNSRLPRSLNQSLMLRSCSSPPTSSSRHSRPSSVVRDDSTGREYLTKKEDKTKIVEATTSQVKEPSRSRPENRDEQRRLLTSRSTSMRRIIEQPTICKPPQPSPTATENLRSRRLKRDLRVRDFLVSRSVSSARNKDKPVVVPLPKPENQTRSRSVKQYNHVSAHPNIRNITKRKQHPCTKSIPSSNLLNENCNIRKSSEEETHKIEICSEAYVSKRVECESTTTVEKESMLELPVQADSAEEKQGTAMPITKSVLECTTKLEPLTIENAAETNTPEDELLRTPASTKNFVFNELKQTPTVPQLDLEPVKQGTAMPITKSVLECTTVLEPLTIENAVETNTPEDELLRTPASTKKFVFNELKQTPTVPQLDLEPVQTISDVCIPITPVSSWNRCPSGQSLARSGAQVEISSINKAVNILDTEETSPTLKQILPLPLFEREVSTITPPEQSHTQRKIVSAYLPRARSHCRRPNLILRDQISRSCSRQRVEFYECMTPKRSQTGIPATPASAKRQLTFFNNFDPLVKIPQTLQIQLREENPQSFPYQIEFYLSTLMNETICDKYISNEYQYEGNEINKANQIRELSIFTLLTMRLYNDFDISVLKDVDKLEQAVIYLLSIIGSYSIEFQLKTVNRLGRALLSLEHVTTNDMCYKILSDYRQTLTPTDSLTSESISIKKKEDCNKKQEYSSIPEVFDTVQVQNGTIRSEEVLHEELCIEEAFIATPYKQSGPKNITLMNMHQVKNNYLQSSIFTSDEVPQSDNESIFKVQKEKVDISSPHSSAKTISSEQSASTLEEKLCSTETNNEKSLENLSKLFDDPKYTAELPSIGSYEQPCALPSQKLELPCSAQKTEIPEGFQIPEKKTEVALPKLFLLKKKLALFSIYDDLRKIPHTLHVKLREEYPKSFPDQIEFYLSTLMNETICDKYISNEYQYEGNEINKANQIRELSIFTLLTMRLYNDFDISVLKDVDKLEQAVIYLLSIIGSYSIEFQLKTVNRLGRALLSLEHVTTNDMCYKILSDYRQTLTPTYNDYTLIELFNMLEYFSQKELIRLRRHENNDEKMIRLSLLMGLRIAIRNGCSTQALFKITKNAYEKAIDENSYSKKNLPVVVPITSHSGNTVNLCIEYETAKYINFIYSYRPCDTVLFFGNITEDTTFESLLEKYMPDFYFEYPAFHDSYIYRRMFLQSSRVILYENHEDKFTKRAIRRYYSTLKEDYHLITVRETSILFFKCSANLFTRDMEKTTKAVMPPL